MVKSNSAVALTGEALVVSEGKIRGKKNSEGKILCWGCSEEGHLRPYCQNPKKPNNNSQKAQESLKPEAKVATTSVVEINSVDKGAWASEEVKLKVEKDWFEELVAEELLKGKNDEFKLIEDIEEIGEAVVEEALEMYPEKHSLWVRLPRLQQKLSYMILAVLTTYLHINLTSKISRPSRPGTSVLQINRRSAPLERENW